MISPGFILLLLVFSIGFSIFLFILNAEKLPLVMLLMFQSFCSIILLFQRIWLTNGLNVSHLEFLVFAVSIIYALSFLLFLKYTEEE